MRTTWEQLQLLSEELENEKRKVVKRFVYVS